MRDGIWDVLIPTSQGDDDDDELDGQELGEWPLPDELFLRERVEQHEAVQRDAAPVSTLQGLREAAHLMQTKSMAARWTTASWTLF